MSLPQTGAATTTYDQVRDWVSEAAGFDNTNPLEIELVNVLMLNALQQVYAQFGITASTSMNGSLTFLLATMCRKRHRCPWDYFHDF